MAKCPDSRKNMAKVNLTFTGYQKQDITQLGKDASNCALLDSACSLMVCKKNLRSYLGSLEDWKKITHNEGQKVFMYRGAKKLRSAREYKLPVLTDRKDIYIKINVVESDILWLLSRSSMKKAGVKMNLVNDTAIIMWKVVALNITSSGHSQLHTNR